jgi:predicted enzyme related to lactoylglutathione lyase
MGSTVRAVLVTADLERLLAFYTGVLGAEEVERVPAEGTPFYLGLRIGDSALGLVADPAVGTGSPGRILLSIDVADVDGLLPRVTALGGAVQGPPNDMPWGQRVAHVHDPDGNTVNLTQDVPGPPG